MSTPIIVPPNLLVDTDPVKSPDDEGLAYLKSVGITDPERYMKEKLTADPKNGLPELITGKSISPDLKVSATPDIIGLPEFPGNKPLPKSPIKPSDIYTGTEAFDITPSGEYKLIPPVIRNENVIPVNQQVAAQQTKKILNETIPLVAKPKDEGKSFWDYIKIANDSNKKPAIVNPEVEAINQAREQQLQKAKAYREATEQQILTRRIEEHRPEQQVLMRLGVTSPQKPIFGDLPTLGKLPPLEHYNGQLEGLSPSWKKQLEL